MSQKTDDLRAEVVRQQKAIDTFTGAEPQRATLNTALVAKQKELADSVEADKRPS